MNRKILLLAACLAVSPLAFADFTQDLQNAGVSIHAIGLLQKNDFDTLNKLKAITYDDLNKMGMHYNDTLAVLSLAGGGQAGTSAKKPEVEKPAADKLPPNSIGMEFVLIPVGEFLMGTDCPKDNPFTEKDEFQEACSDKTAEVPQHKITISEPFYLGKTEVTQMQWWSVTGKNPAFFKAEKAGVSAEVAANLPVEQITWLDAQEFIQKLNAKENCQDCYFIPTEAQWEYAARAGTTTAYHFGDNPADLGKYAWSKENSEEKTHPVGGKEPNQWGLYDMAGNVWEWTCSEYAAYSDTPGAETQCTSKKDANVVLRGGAWNDNLAQCRAAARNNNAPAGRYYNIGLRVARRVAPRT